MPIANLNARQTRPLVATARGNTNPPLGPPQPSPEYISSAVAAKNRTVLLLIKPRCFLDEVGNRLLGYRQSLPTEMVAKEIEAAFDPADEGFVLLRCMSPFMGQSRQLVQRTDTSEIEVQADITRTSLFGR